MSQNSSSSAGRPATRITRRRFATTLAGAAAGALAAPAIVRGRNLNEKLNIAMIGSGGRGAHNLKQFADENIVVLCDVKDEALERAAMEHSQARRFKDFRRVFDHANSFDAVVVSTTEHTHAFATLPALQLGKHVYCEKPLTYNIAEARIIREAAAKAKVATQMGNQNHANENYRRVIELIQSGAVGPVSEVHVWVSRAWGWQPHLPVERSKDPHWVTNDRPTTSDPVPSGLDWDLWLGPAPARPFSNAYLPGPRWYRFWDFGNGTMSDLGSHMNDLPFWSLKLKAPRTVEAFGPPPNPDIAPASMHATYEYDARGDMPPVRMTWYQGDDKPEPWQSGAIPKWRDGMLFMGTKGMILSDHQKHVLLPEKEFKDFKRPAPTMAKSLGHWAEWVHACKTVAPTLSNFEYAGWLTEANHLGNVAFRTGKKIEWDPARLAATNAPEAERFIRRDYRKGWSLS